MATIPAIQKFLGYDPYTEGKTLGERMRTLRRTKGWTIREAAQQLGVDESSWGQWERTGRIQWERYQNLLETFLEEKQPR